MRKHLRFSSRLAFVDTFLLSTESPLHVVYLFAKSKSKGLKGQVDL